MARVTVLMAVYNSADTIEECIQSILDQTYSDFKVLILDDLCTDNTMELIQAFQSDKIEIMHFKKKDYIHALNTGLDYCDTEYIARMDGDDIMLPGRLEEQVKFMDSHPNIAACGSYVRTFGNYSKTWTRYRTNPEQLRRNFYWFCSINNPASFIRNSVIKAHEIRYNPEYNATEDFKFWIDLSKVGTLTNIPKVLLKYRVHNSHCLKLRLKSNDDLQRIRRESITDFLDNHGLSIRLDDFNDKLGLLRRVQRLKVAPRDRWHKSMTQYMLIQSSEKLSFWRFLKLLFTTPFVFDRNSAELIWKMIRTKSGMNEKPMV